MKFTALLLGVLASCTSAYNFQSASVEFESMSSACVTGNQGNDWYCPYQCALQGFSVTSYNYYQGPFDMAGRYVSGCNCDLDGTWVNESASGTFYTASFASGTWVATVADSLSDMTVTYTLESQVCIADFSLSTGCLDPPNSNVCGGPTIYVSWWWYGAPLIVIIIVASSIGTTIRMRRLRALRLANAGYYATTTTTTMAPAPVQYVQPTVAQVNYPVAVAQT